MTRVRPQIFQFQLSQINTQVQRQIRNQIRDQICDQFLWRVWAPVLEKVYTQLDKDQV